MPRITLAQFKTLASAHEFSVSKRDGEYRVAPYRPRDPQWCEDRAYYTDDASDAMDTLNAMIHEAHMSKMRHKRPAWLDGEPEPG